MKALGAHRTKDDSPFGGRIRFVVSVGLAAGLMFAAMPCEAAHAVSSARPTPKAVQEKVATAASKDVEETGAIQSGSDMTSCSKSRQRLFVEGEGWIVRKVTTCY